MVFPNLRRIFSSFRTPEEERQISREAFFKFVGFVVSCIAITMLSNKNRMRAIGQSGGG